MSWSSESRLAVLVEGTEALLPEDSGVALEGDGVLSRNAVMFLQENLGIGLGIVSSPPIPM